jgi:8-amino-7-oxononanoate synthase
VLEFTSALYLGLRHSSASLRPWSQLTTGAPAALIEPDIAVDAARKLAALQGLESATLGASTFHLFWDLAGVFAGAHVSIYADAEAYPIALWAMERAAAHGTPVRRFAHHNANGLADELRRDRSGRQPVVVSDGLCPHCGRVAPLREYLELAAPSGGWLVVDDTQALGILGHSRHKRRPYGEGGGGMPRWSRISSPRLIVVASLAKAFGAPTAALSGSASFIKFFKESSATRVHCSPPSTAAIQAMESALAINRSRGHALRSGLAKRVSWFQTRLARIGLRATGGAFPMQTLAMVPGWDATTLHQRFLDYGVSAVLHQPYARRPARISFLINRRHTLEQIARAVDAIGVAVAEVRPRPALIASKPRSIFTPMEGACFEKSIRR